MGHKGPYTHGEEKEYWDALMSYTVELFSDMPDEVESNVGRVRNARRWFALGKYAKAYPFTMEAESYHAGLIDSDEGRALGDQAFARFNAVVALANAFVPLEKLHLMGFKLEFDEMAEMV